MPNLLWIHGAAAFWSFTRSTSGPTITPHVHPIVLAAAGIAMIRVVALSTVPDPFDDPNVRRVLDDNRLGGQAPQSPMYLYHGSSQVFLGDEFIPESGVLALQHQWCAGGANVTYVPVWGEHLTAAIAGAPGMLDWIADRLAGVPAPPGGP